MTNYEEHLLFFAPDVVTFKSKVTKVKVTHHILYTNPAGIFLKALFNNLHALAQNIEWFIYTYARTCLFG